MPRCTGKLSHLQGDSFTGLHSPGPYAIRRLPTSTGMIRRISYRSAGHCLTLQNGYGMGHLRVIGAVSARLSQNETSCGGRYLLHSGQSCTLPSPLQR